MDFKTFSTMKRSVSITRLSLSFNTNVGFLSKKFPWSRKSCQRRNQSPKKCYSGIKFHWFDMLQHPSRITNENIKSWSLLACRYSLQRVCCFDDIFFLIFFFFFYSRQTYRHTHTGPMAETLTFRHWGP